jgi:hypothetical protein
MSFTVCIVPYQLTAAIIRYAEFVITYAITLLQQKKEDNL